MANRKKSSIKGAVFFVALLLVVSVISFQIGSSIGMYIYEMKQAQISYKDVSYEEMTISLPSDFHEVSGVGKFSAIYTNYEIYVGVYKKGVEDLEGVEDFESYSMEEFLAEVLSGDRIINYKIDGKYAWYSNYYIDDTNIKYYYYTNVCKTDDAFWCIVFLA